MDEQWYKERCCGDKKKYARLEWAEEALAGGKKSGHYSWNYHVYECPFCYKYHIGKDYKAKLPFSEEYVYE